MNSDDGNEPSDLADDIVGVDSYEAPVPAKKVFLPWHRPRKQFVRVKQWCEQIRKLLDEIQIEGGALRYFGLPGVDLLDLRCFHHTICVPRNLKLCFLGFNSGSDPASSEQAELNISLDEVSKLGSIDPRSMVIPDDFRRLASDQSIAWQRTLALGPFDVLNLDLCGGFGADAGGELSDTYYNAVNRLLAIQCRRKHPWLLFLTTRVGAAHIDQGTMRRLLQKYANNLSECDGFQEESEIRFQIGNENALNSAAGTDEGLHRIFLVGICKWLLGLAVGQAPPSSIEVKSVLGYHVDQGCGLVDLVSLAIKFTPSFSPVEDSSRLAAAQTRAPDECVLAVNALRRVAKLRDVDAILAQNINLKDEMIKGMSKLLESARYDVVAYAKWVVAQEQVA